ncbi:MAG: 50S ribosomal protein L35 [Armatimonadetes bacterium]|nr:50S ribosomal protein L35 [Armatimonadota bacterium]NIM23953.1 50S ribosomal protein L35 [Armatimonadota bacterium]NIM67800.1 50S ribosomal protein L35 [Armatimonadota bacterium]NIM76340.1 50S ribosomal protein L35 [Armatimonadota bacterium]NIN06034.1 50S ribosomal protein L35 [Armatimonadota bacterium]
MPKMKTRKSVTKRISVTGRGKMLTRHARTSHMKAGKSESSKRRLSVPGKISKKDQKSVRRALPYLGK